MKKITAVMLSLILFLLSLNVSALATTPDETSDEAISAKLRVSVANMGVSVNERSIIQEVPIQSTVGHCGRGIVVTNIKDDRITKDVLILVDEDGISDFVDVALRDKDTCSPQAGSTVEFPPLDWDGRYVIRGTAVYEQYSDGLFSSYYRPLAAFFTYKKYKPCSVSSINSKIHY